MPRPKYGFSDLLSAISGPLPQPVTEPSRPEPTSAGRSANSGSFQLPDRMILSTEGLIVVANVLLKSFDQMMDPLPIIHFPRWPYYPCGAATPGTGGVGREQKRMGGSFRNQTPSVNSHP